MDDWATTENLKIASPKTNLNVNVENLFNANFKISATLWTRFQNIVNEIINSDPIIEHCIMINNKLRGIPLYRLKSLLHLDLQKNDLLLWRGI